MKLKGVISLAAGCAPCDARARYALQTQVDETATTADASDLVPWRGVLVVEGEMTGDGRLIENGALRWDVEQPRLPIRWVREDSGIPHDGAVLVGWIEISSMERVADEIVAEGMLDASVDVDGDNPVRLLSEGMPLGISVDLDDISFEIRVDQELFEEGIPDEIETDDEGRVIVVGIASGEEVFVVTDARIRGATLGDIPAFDRAAIELVASGKLDELRVGWSFERAKIRLALTASVIGDRDLPVASLDHDWDGSAAAGRMFDACENDGELDGSCASRGFLYRDDDADPATRGAYKLPYADLVDGTLTIIPAGVQAVANALAGGRGGVDVPSDEMSALESAVCSLYERVRDTHGEDAPECPFSGDTEELTAAAGDGHAMIALLPSDPESLAVDDGDPADRLHVTLVFLGDADNADTVTEDMLDAIAETAFANGPIEVRVAGLGILGDEDPSATILLLNGAQIDDTRLSALAALGDAPPDQHSPFIPHLTVGYGVPLDAVDALKGETFTLDTVALVVGGERVIARSAAGDDAEQLAASAATAVELKVPVRPSFEWFKNPQLQAATRLNVTDDGRVYGHIALWDGCHTGYAQCVRPPKGTNYAYFLTGTTRTSEGDDVPTGPITVNTTHANHRLGAGETVAHYEHTGTAVADVHIGEDRYGIWVAGALRPGTTDAQLRELLSSTPSGDWRRMRGRLELIAVLAVNVPGFPIVASAHVEGVDVTSLIVGWNKANEKVSKGVDVNAVLARTRERRRRRLVAEQTLRVLDARVDRGR